MTKPKQRLRRAAAYIRMSTDQQADSPARQRAIIERLAEREGCKIVEWYEDHGQTGTESDHRDGFQRLLDDAGRKRFQAVLLTEQSRFSREDVLDVLAHVRALKAAGVALITEHRGTINLDDFGSLLGLIVDAHAANDEAIKISSRTTSGKRTKLNRGQRCMGIRLFAYDRIYKEGGKVVKRAHFRESFQKPTGWEVEIVPSDDVEAVEALRWMFGRYLEGASDLMIASELNDRGITTTAGKRFCWSTVARILTNPAYMGTLRAGHRARGKYNRVVDDSEGTFLKENAHPALIDAKLFHRVQKLRAIRSVGARVRSEPGTHLLSGIVRCHCGERAYGRKCKRNEYKGARHGEARRDYECASHAKPNSTGQHLTIKAEWIEDFVIAKVKEQLDKPHIVRELNAFVSRHNSASESTVDVDEARLSDLEAKIERGEENLALAESAASFAAIQKHLTKWREQRDELAEAIEAERGTITITPQAFAALGLLQQGLKALERADRVPLRDALLVVIKEVTVNREVIKGQASSIAKSRGAKRTFQIVRYSGRIEFHPGIFDDDVIEFANESFGQDERWMTLATYVRSQGRLVRSREAAEQIGVNVTLGASFLKRAEVAGLVKWAGSAKDGGWVAVDIPDALLIPLHLEEVVEFCLENPAGLSLADVVERFEISKTAARDRIRAARRLNLLSCSDPVMGRGISVPTRQALALHRERDRYATLLRKVGCELTVDDIAAKANASPTVALWWLSRAKAAGLVRQTEDGWSSMTPARRTKRSASRQLGIVRAAS